jgi:two-component system sensor histidine kinase/response regulator
MPPHTPALLPPEIEDAKSTLEGLAQVYLPHLSADEITTFSGPQTETAEWDEASAEARYRTLLEQIPAVVFMAHLDGGIGDAYVSPHIEALLGFKQQEWLEEPIRWYRQIHPEDKTRWSLEAAALFLSGEALHSVYRVLAKDGHTVWFQCDAQMVRRPDGRPWFVHGVGFDITSLKRTETSLEDALADAQAANRAKSEFLTNMSHELRTPINGIMGMADLVLGTNVDAEQRDYLQVIKHSADALLRVVSDILDFTQIEARTLELRIVQFSLRQCLEGALKLLAGSAHDKGLELACDVPACVEDVLMGDPDRLRQVIANLVSNGVKFTQTGGVALHVGMDSRTADDISLHFQVIDTGIGIPLDKQRLIFEAFSQADTSSTRRYGGTGLGLTLSSLLVKLMDGKLWVESEPGCGSTFHFTARLGLPRRQRTALMDGSGHQWQQATALRGLK